MMPEREQLSAFYRRYLGRCNEHRFGALGEFVAEDVGGSADGLLVYISGLYAARSPTAGATSAARSVTS